MSARKTNLTRREILDRARAIWHQMKPGVSERFWSKVDVRGEDECWPWKAAERKKGDGYGAFWLDGRHQPAGRVALELSGTNVPEGMHVCHKCDNPPCCNPKHLFVGTHQENNQDKVRKGRHAHGERNGNAKLTSAQVAEIRSYRPPGVKRVKPGVPQMLAERYGITRQYVSEIFKGSWKNQ